MEAWTVTVRSRRAIGVRNRPWSYTKSFASRLTLIITATFDALAAALCEVAHVLALGGSVLAGIAVLWLWLWLCSHWHCDRLESISTSLTAPVHARTLAPAWFSSRQSSKTHSLPHLVLCLLPCYTYVVLLTIARRPPRCQNRPHSSLHPQHSCLRNNIPSPCCCSSDSLLLTCCHATPTCSSPPS